MKCSREWAAPGRCSRVSITIQADIVTIAKGIGSGLPIGACVARADLMDWKPGAHASTFGGNPVCIAAALKTIELLEGGLVQNAAEVGLT